MVVFIAAISLVWIGAAAAGEIDVNNEIKNRLLSKYGGHNGVYKAVFGKDPGWVNFKGVNFKGNTKGNFTYSKTGAALPESLEVMGEDIVANCGAGEVAQYFERTVTTHDESSWGTESTLSVEASLSASLPFGEASVTVGYSTTKGSQTVTGKDVETKRHTDYKIPTGKRGHAQFIAHNKKADDITFTLDITLSGDTDLSFDVGRVCLYEHRDYGGAERCYQGVGTRAHLDGFNDITSSVKVFGDVKVRLFEGMTGPGGVGGTGDSFVTTGTNWVGDKWNDRASAILIFSDRDYPQTATVQIEKHITEPITQKGTYKGNHYATWDIRIDTKVDATATDCQMINAAAAKPGDKEGAKPQAKAVKLERKGPATPLPASAIKSSGEITPKK